ncbi:hypothetical protein F4778DRAFT_782617 [Xylariomycetidae sp. FL2044]|nr:hypothetical protein F4778DRAFT_782617 [Xylariomycetidae sp. FL2044]
MDDLNDDQSLRRRTPSATAITLNDYLELKRDVANLKQAMSAAHARRDAQEAACAANFEAIRSYLHKADGLVKAIIVIAIILIVFAVICVLGETLIIGIWLGGGMESLESSSAIIKSLSTAQGRDRVLTRQ